MTDAGGRRPAGRACRPDLTAGFKGAETHRARPLSASKGGASIGLRIERGLGYLVPVLDASTFRDLRAAAGGPALCFVSSTGIGVPDGEDAVSLAVSGRPGDVDPRRPQDLRARAASFLDPRPGGVVVVDCVASLASNVGIERTVRALQDLHEEVASRDAILVVLLDPRTAPPRMVAWLEREFEILPASGADLAVIGLPTG